MKLAAIQELAVIAERQPNRQIDKKPQDNLTNEKNNITNANSYFPDNTNFGDCLQQPS